MADAYRAWVVLDAREAERAAATAKLERIVEDAWPARREKADSLYWVGYRAALDAVLRAWEDEIDPAVHPECAVRRVEELERCRAFARWCFDTASSDDGDVDFYGLTEKMLDLGILRTEQVVEGSRVDVVAVWADDLARYAATKDPENALDEARETVGEGRG